MPTMVWSVARADDGYWYGYFACEGTNWEWASCVKSADREKVYAHMLRDYAPYGDARVKDGDHA